MNILKFKAWLPSQNYMGVPFDVLEELNNTLGKFPPDTILLQFTGRTDRDGTEIYVGDIYSWDYEYDSDYDGDMPIVKRSTGVREVKDIFDTMEIYTAAREGKGVKLIGNIYQHAHLLNR